MNAVVNSGISTAGNFSLSPLLDHGELGATFQSQRRLRITDCFSASDALALHQALTERTQWRPFLITNGRMLSAAPDGDGTYSRELEQEIASRAFAGAQWGLASSYEADRLFHEDVPPGAQLPEFTEDTVLEDFYQFANSPGFLTFARTVTGIAEIERASIQANRFRPGHFTTYTTAPASGDQSGIACAAFVVNLTIEWLVEWGGLLHFNGNEAYMAEAYVPSFNALDFYTLPQGSWISLVAPFARGERLSISGRLYGR